MGHKRLAGSLVGLTVVLLGLASVAVGQDLAALARKEKARRAKVAKPARVITEDDTRSPDAPAPSKTPSPEATPSATPSAAAPTVDDPAAREDQERAQWKERALAVRDAIQQAEARLALMEKESAALRSDLTQVSAAEAQDPMRLQKRDQKIAESNQAIEAQKRAVADARKAWTQLEEDARRKGVPPGWLR